MGIWDLKKQLLAISAVLLLASCQQAKQEDKDSTDAAKSEQSAKESVKDEDKIGYALGAKMATFIRNDLEKYKMQGINKESVAAGFEDALQNQSKLDQKEIEQQFAQFQQKIQAAHLVAQQEAEAQAMAEAKEKAKPEIEAGDAFLAENAKKEGVKITESGIQYRVVKEGKIGAAKPAATDRVRVHYHGTFIDGKVFDSSVERDQPAEFALNQVIAGWTEGLQLMSVGSKYHFVIPWEKAYGWQGRPGAIPGFSVLQFEVELLDINPSSEKPKKAETKTN
ncbi:MAG: FKBP-type peptidyl-prolyl cis-trans isomerase [Kangiellaceae bacterium]